MHYTLFCRGQFGRGGREFDCLSSLVFLPPECISFPDTNTGRATRTFCFSSQQNCWSNACHTLFSLRFLQFPSFLFKFGALKLRFCFCFCNYLTKCSFEINNHAILTDIQTSRHPFKRRRENKSWWDILLLTFQDTISKNPKAFHRVFHKEPSKTIAHSIFILTLDYKLRMYYIYCTQPQKEEEEEEYM